MRARLSLAAALAALLVYWLGWSGLPHAVDELSALSVTESIAATGTLHTTQMEWDQARTPPQNSRGADGLLYSKKGIGVSLAALPLWALGSWLPASPLALSFLAGSLLGALATGAMVWAALALGYGRATALIAGGALALGTLQWPYARTLFSEAIAGPGLALALAGAICAACCVLREEADLTPRPPLHVERGSTATAFALLPLSTWRGGRGVRLPSALGGLLTGLCPRRPWPPPVIK